MPSSLLGQATASGMDVVPKLAEDDASSVVSSMDGSTYGDYGMTGECMKEMVNIGKYVHLSSVLCTSVTRCNVVKVMMVEWLMIQAVMTKRLYIWRTCY